jgi:hypothetical protein
VKKFIFFLHFSVSGIKLKSSNGNQRLFQNFSFEKTGKACPATLKSNSFAGHRPESDKSLEKPTAF